MSAAISCLLIACVIPTVLTWISGYHRHKQLGFVDNKNPRSQYSLLDGAGARAVAAQHNSWEALALYTAALVAVLIANIPLESIATVSITFIVSRVIYVALYLLNYDRLRSLVFIIGFACCMYLFYLALSNL